MLEMSKYLKASSSGHGKKSFFHLHFFLFFMIHITAADTGNCAVFRGKLLADLQNFFFIHKSDTLPYDIVTIKDSIESFRGKINGF